VCYQNSKPLISVVVPIYNIENYIRKCIESIQNQTYKKIEIILVDDGSTDLSGKICDEYALNDSRIKVIHKKNGGLVSARKVGIENAEGMYATYVDGDDWIESDMYEKLLNQIVDADIIISGKIRDYGDHSVYERNKIPEGIYNADDLKNIIYATMMYTGRFYERGISPQIYQNLYVKEILLKNQLKVPDNINVGEDAACTYPTILDAKKIVVTSDCFYHYQIRADSIMGISNDNELQCFKILYKYLKKCFSEKKDLKKNLTNQLDYMMLYMLMLKDIKYVSLKDEIFPYSGIKLGSKIVVYGTGRFGKELVYFIRKQGYYSVVAWVDSSEKTEAINQLKETEYDCIIIAVLIREMAEIIRKDLINMGIHKNKIKNIDMKRIEEIKLDDIF